MCTKFDFPSLCRIRPNTVYLQLLTVVTGDVCEHDGVTYNLHDVISFADCTTRVDNVMHLAAYEAHCLPGGVWSNPPPSCLELCKQSLVVVLTLSNT